MNEQTQLVFYSAHARELVGKTDGKIKAILAQNCLEYVREEGNNHYACKPIKNPDGSPYNKHTYELKASKQFGFTCNCQGWQTKYKKHMADPVNSHSPNCSHVAALFEFLKRQHLHIRAEKIYGGFQTVFGVD